MKKFVTLVFVLVFVLVAQAQPVPEMHRPKLVVGIMVDQMRWDYLTRYYDRYTDGGFRRLMADGYNCNRLLINYLPTVTAVGHTSVYTGSVPAFTGIVANTFPIDGKFATSVHDDSVHTVGASGKIGMSSPHKLLVTTITDELRLATNFRSKTIAIALKDRASILPAGHAANAAYWLDYKNLRFITSSYYMNVLPKWLNDFNKSGKAQSYVKIINGRKNKDDFWDLLYPEQSYVQSGSGKKERYYDYHEMTGALNMTPWGNTITADMAIAAIDGEALGKNPAGVPDFLAVSFSCTDMIGHQIGPNSIWQEDVFLRLDKDIARLLAHLDSAVGKDNYVVFLSADHAGAHNPEFLKDHKIPAGSLECRPLAKELNNSLRTRFHITDNVVSGLDNLQIYLNPKYVDNTEVTNYISRIMESKKSVKYCFALRNIPSYIPEPVRTMAVNGYCAGRSGDMQIIPASQYLEGWDAGSANWDGITRGTSHSVWNPYDAHIPFIIMGPGIRHAWDNQTHHITDIAATLAAILNIQQPSACVGDAIPVEKIQPTP